MGITDGCTRNQIDYVIIAQRWKSSCVDVKTYPSADCGTDHQLLVARLRIKLKVGKNPTNVQRFDFSKISEEYTIPVCNRFQELLKLGESTSPDELWSEISNTIKEMQKSTFLLRGGRISHGFRSTQLI